MRPSGCISKWNPKGYLHADVLQIVLFNTGKAYKVTVTRPRWTGSMCIYFKGKGYLYGFHFPVFGMRWLHSGNLIRCQFGAVLAVCDREAWLLKLVFFKNFTDCRFDLVFDLVFHGNWQDRVIPFVIRIAACFHPVSKQVVRLYP